MKVLEIYIYSVPFVNKNLLEKEKKKNMKMYVIPTFFGCESSPINRNVVSQLVIKCSKAQ